ncbi:hypothetical protein B0H14DRAFT_3423929 [Mycena olivaceomarginata]|nr:hypothetical protein B0H14DRAFT_3423929 [Mycena olivaceomarginata]
MELENNWPSMKNEEWFATALASALGKKKDVDGEKGAMAGHLRRCGFATAEEKALAARAAPTKQEKKKAEEEAKAKRKQAGGGEDDVDADDEGAGDAGGRKKRKLVQAVETSFSQSKLNVYKGNDIPFSEDHKRAIARQTLRATQSANLPERWTSDPEVMKLFMMMRSRAMDAIPSRSQLWRSLLGQAAELYLLSSFLIGQLILSDYLKENDEAATLMGQLIDFVNWRNNHDKVRAIFDTKQQEIFGKILAYLLPNLTRWTTHLVAAIRFEFLKVPIRAAILNHRDAIVKAQVGAENNARKRLALEEDAIRHCDLVASNAWWDKLRKTVIPDLEHICYSPTLHRVTTFALISSSLLSAVFFCTFTDFFARQKAPERSLGRFVLALILNPFEKLSRFGDKAQIDVFKISTELVTLFKRMNSRPPKTPRTTPEQDAFDAKLRETAQVINTTFMQYLIEAGPFESWFAKNSPQRVSYDALHAEEQTVLCTMNDSEDMEFYYA